MATTRRSRDETRTLMLDAGVEVLLRDGISLGASTVRYADAFKLLQEEHGIKVTRGSVHQRIWASQEAWQFDVIAESIHRDEAGRRQALNEAVAARVLELPADTAVERLNALAESCRVVSLAFLDLTTEQPSHRLFPVILAAWKASANNLPEFHRLGQVLREVQQDSRASYERNLVQLLEHLRIGVAPERGLSFESAVRAHAINSTALAYSHTLRSLVDPALTEQFQVRCPDGELRAWNHLGLGIWLMARGRFIPKDESPPS